MAAEAMACGCCVVAYRTGALPEFIDDGVSGILVQQRNPSALSNALDAMLRHPDSIPAIGTAASAYAAKNLGIGAHVTALTELCERVAQTR
jgi:glycosyltransferase involved in cell wall biosynthesis